MFSDRVTEGLSSGGSAVQSESFNCLQQVVPLPEQRLLFLPNCRANTHNQVE